MERYLPVDKIHLPTTMKFAPEGHCEWCGKELTGRCRKFCPVGPDDTYRNISNCALAFYNYWYAIPAFKRAVFLRDNFTCQKCGYREVFRESPWLPILRKLHCDHIIPLSRSGETEISNLQTLCEKCNRAKGNRLEGEERVPVPARLSKRERLIAAGQLCFEGIF